MADRFRFKGGATPGNRNRRGLRCTCADAVAAAVPARFVAEVSDAQASQQYAIRITCLAIALAVGGIGWLAWRYLDNARELPWVLWGAAGVGAILALVAPVRWLRTALHMNLLTQDLFRR